jgi:hypothetical protein
MRKSARTRRSGLRAGTVIILAGAIGFGVGRLFVCITGGLKKLAAKVGRLIYGTGPKTYWAGSKTGSTYELARSSVYEQIEVFDPSATLAHSTVAAGKINQVS